MSIYLLAEGTSSLSTTYTKLGSTYTVKGMVQIFIYQYNENIYYGAIQIREKVISTGSQRIIWTGIAPAQLRTTKTVLVSPAIMVANTWEIYAVCGGTVTQVEYSVRISQ